MIELRIIGNPSPQGSKRFVGVSKRTGRGIMVESCAGVKPWREAVVIAAREAMAGRPAPLLRGPISMQVCFTLSKPKSAPKRRETLPDRKPDLSKLVRSTEDALSDAGIWEDDARVVWCEAMKAYPGESNDALDVPGAVIRVTELQGAKAGTRG